MCSSDLSFGVDPGIGIMGYGVVAQDKDRLEALDYGGECFQHGSGQRRAGVLGRMDGGGREFDDVVDVVGDVVAVIPDALQVAEEVDEVHALLRVAQAMIQALDVIFSVLPLLVVDLVLKIFDDAIRLGSHRPTATALLLPARRHGWPLRASRAAP